jgi:hypothetical protein
VKSLFLLNIHEESECGKGYNMTFWILVFVIPIIIIAIVEEMIYFLVNRRVFGPSKLELSVVEFLKMLGKKLTNIRGRRKIKENKGS